MLGDEGCKENLRTKRNFFPNGKTPLYGNFGGGYDFCAFQLIPPMFHSTHIMFSRYSSLVCVFAGITGDCMLEMLEGEYTAGVCQTILVSLEMNSCYLCWLSITFTM